MNIDTIKQELGNRLSKANDLAFIPLIEISSIIQRVGNIVLGILALMVVILVPIIVGAEVAYICFPFIREKTNELLTKLETKGVDKRLLGIAFRDAKHAVETVWCRGELEGTTTDMLGVYFRVKIKAIVFVFFIVTLTTQGGTFLVEFVWSLVGNVIQYLFY